MRSTPTSVLSTDFWYDHGPDRRPDQLFSYINTLDGPQNLMRALNAENARVYAGKDVPGIGGHYATPIGSYGYTAVENGVGSIVDTAVAQIAATRPQVTFQTDGASWSKQRHAKRLQRFVAGLYDKLKIYQLAVDIFKDACIFGTGCIKIFTANNEICAERVLIDDIVVDEQEARDSAPRQMAQRKLVDREVLKRLYPDKAMELLKADTTAQRTYSWLQPNSNMVEVIEAWHLPSGPDADDGLHTICTRSINLFEEQYTKDYFPFVFMRWQKPITGFYGVGIVEPLTPLQMRLNQLHRFIKKCQDIIAVPRIFGDFSSRMTDDFFTNEVAMFFPMKEGRVPSFYTPQALTAETYNERERCLSSMYKLAGVSEMAAQAKKEPGITAGVALRQISELQTGRFAIQSEWFEDFHLQVGERLVWAARDLWESSGDEDGNGRTDVVAEFHAKRFMDTIKWSEIDPKEDHFKISIAASSLLSRTPAGRLQEAMDLLQLGIIDRKGFLRVVDHPDLQRIIDEEDADAQDIEALIENLESGKWESPEPLQNLSLGCRTVQRAYLSIRRQDAPEEILDLFRQWIDMAQEMLKQAQQPANDQVSPGQVPGQALPPPGAPLPVTAAA